MPFVVESRTIVMEGRTVLMSPVMDVFEQLVGMDAQTDGGRREPSDDEKGGQEA